MADIFGLYNMPGLAEDNEALAGKMANGLSTQGKYASFCLDGGTVLCESSWLGRQGSKTRALNVPCVLDGEIYNRNELLALLGLDKHEKMSDAEIIYALYEKKFHGFPRQINGIFAFALFDPSRRELILARDHLGSRSLYFTYDGYSTCFSTKTKGLLTSGVADSTLSQEAIYSFLCSVSLTPPTTMYSAIKALRPASIVTIDTKGTFKEDIYWDIAQICEDRTRTFEDFSEELKELIIDAVRCRALNGGQIGTIVSGGVDTSIITSLLCDSLPEEKKIPAFSIGFKEQAYSDAGLQELMYDKYPLERHQSIISADQYWQLLQKVMHNLDAPVNDDAAVGMYRVFELASEYGCTAVFEGEAADELFFTTHVHSERQFQKLKQIVPDWFRFNVLQRVSPSLPVGGGLFKKIRRQVFRLGLSDTDRRLMVLPSYYRSGLKILKEGTAQSKFDPLAHARAYLQETSLCDPLNVYYYGLLKTFLPDDLLYKNERMASANKVVNRTPFIDYRLAELAFRMPETMKVNAPSSRSDGTKLIYKNAIEGIIPAGILNRKKSRGFSMPASVWFRGELRDKVDSVLSSNSEVYNYLDSQTVGMIAHNFKRGLLGYDRMYKSIFYLGLWLKQQNANRADL